MDWTNPSTLFFISSGFAPTTFSNRSSSFSNKNVGIAFTSILVATSWSPPKPKHKPEREKSRYHSESLPLPHFMLARIAVGFCAYALLLHFCSLCCYVLCATVAAAAVLSTMVEWGRWVVVGESWKWGIAEGIGVGIAKWKGEIEFLSLKKKIQNNLVLMSLVPESYLTAPSYTQFFFLKKFNGYVNPNMYPYPKRTQYGYFCQNEVPMLHRLFVIQTYSTN